MTQSPNRTAMIDVPSSTATTWFDRGRRVYRAVMTRPLLVRTVVATVRREQQARMVRPGFDILIDGYPRSANTFAVHAFQSVNPSARVAHHLHCVGHIRMGLRLGIPTVLVVRDPADAAMSEVIRDGRHSLRGALDDWLHLHARLLDDLDALQVAPIEIVTSDFGSVIRAVNDRWGTAFEPYTHDPARDDAVLASVREVTETKWASSAERTRRSPQPDERRSEARPELEAQLRDPRVAALLAEARDVYDRVAGGWTGQA